MYDPEGAVAKQLTPLLVNELTSKYGIPDDAQDVAEYINVLIGNNRSAADICSEVKEVVNIPIDEGFVTAVFSEISRLEGSAAQEQPPQISQNPPQISQNLPQQPPQEQPQFQQPPQQPAQFQQPPQEQVAQFQQPLQEQFQQPQQNFQTFQPPANVSAFPVQSAFPDAFPPQTHFEDKEMHVDFQKSGPEMRRTLPTGPKGRRAGGVGKDYSAKGAQKKSYGMQNAANLEKALSLSSNAQSVNVPFVRKPKGRCTDFPYCKNRECALAHPTKKCFAYPSCPNPPGTCDYLHPSEDTVLMAELEKTKKQFLERQQERYAPQPQVTLCTYGILCSKELCPFGHPTPANKDAKVINARWCRANKKCENPDCEYAHSSPNYQAPAAPVHPSATGGFNKYATKHKATTLEQCKFALYCTNYQCPKRHATSHAACRAGESCTRMDCYFNHLIDEDCRFADGCRNNPCFFRHPDGREKAHFGGESTNTRAFAVPDDQIMEQAVQE